MAKNAKRQDGSVVPMKSEQVQSPAPVVDPLGAVQAVEQAEQAIERDSAAAQAEIQSAIVIARRFPRNVQAAYAAIMSACQRKKMAAEGVYSFPRAGSNVTGPSVGLAREMARTWGNIRYGLEIIRDDDDNRSIRAWSWDLETNVKTSAEDTFAKLIYRREKGWVKPDERDLRELTNRRGAFIVRNCILSLMPSDVVEEAVDACFDTLSKEAVTSREEVVRRLVTNYQSIGVDVKAIERKLGHPIDNASPDEITQLRMIYRSIHDGQSKVGEYFTFANATAPSATPADAPSVDKVLGAVKTTSAPTVAPVDVKSNDDLRAKIDDLIFDDKVRVSEVVAAVVSAGLIGADGKGDWREAVLKATKTQADIVRRALKV